MARSRFASTTTKGDKRELGRTAVEQTPVAIRSRVELPEGFSGSIRERLGRKLGYAGPLIERGTVRFEVLNGPKGGVDNVCRIMLVLSSRPSVQVDARGRGPREAFTRALPKLATTLQQAKEKHELSIPETPPPAPEARAGRGPRTAARAANGANGGEIIGPRVGRGAAAKAAALARPEKEQRDVYVDTAAPGVSETDRKAGGKFSARRNTLGKAPRATVALEDSRTTPSRKSTRGSSNRAKPSQGKERTAVAKSLTPRAKATRAKAARGRSG
jgi:hypothetical protein